MPTIPLATRLSTLAWVVGCWTFVPATPASAVSVATSHQTPHASLVEPRARYTTPDDFNIRTTTDTEVRRLRTALTLEVLDAVVNLGRAETNLDDRQGEHQQRREDRQQALDAVNHLEEISVQTAVLQFMGAQSDQQTSGLPSPTDDLAEATLSSHANDQLANKRMTATERLEQADLEVEKTAHDVQRARLLLAEMRRTLQSKRERLAAFERRADEHRQVAIDADRRAAARSSEVDLRSVAGTLIVNSTIEADVDRLLADARLDGHDLSGGGFRTHEQQIRLRLAHCDSDHGPDDAHDPTDVAHVNWVIHEAPANSCSPPTAPPGQSQHQTGLAIDFTESGRLLTRASPGYRWLVDNAHIYGLINLPSEPWHWSTTGR